MTRTRFAAAAAALLAALAVNRPAAAGPPRADPPHEEPVAHWNRVAAQAYAPTQGTQPLPQSRTFAILHAAIHDALNAIDRRFVPYTSGLAAAPGASVDVAVATAAREVLVALIPDQAALVDDAYYRVFIGIPEGPAKAAGIAVGRAAAQATLNRRATDGIDRVTQPVYVPKATAGEYRFTAPFDLALVPGWGRLQPFAIDLADHRLEGRCRSRAQEHARDLAYLQLDRRARQHDADRRAVDHRPVLVPRTRRSGGPHHEHRGPPARARLVGGGADVRAGQLRARGRLYRRLRGQVPLPLLAAGDGDPRRRRRRQPGHDRGPGLAAVPDDTAGARRTRRRTPSSASPPPRS